MENPIKIDDISGTPISGNLHMGLPENEVSPPTDSAICFIGMMMNQFMEWGSLFFRQSYSCIWWGVISCIRLHVQLRI